MIFESNYRRQAMKSLTRTKTETAQEVSNSLLETVYLTKNPILKFICVTLLGLFNSNNIP